jgi:hypothetical protein
MLQISPMASLTVSSISPNSGHARGDFDRSRAAGAEDAGAAQNPAEANHCRDRLAVEMRRSRVGLAPDANHHLKDLLDARFQVLRIGDQVNGFPQR